VLRKRPLGQCDRFERETLGQFAITPSERTRLSAHPEPSEGKNNRDLTRLPDPDAPHFLCCPSVVMRRHGKGMRADWGSHLLRYSSFSAGWTVNSQRGWRCTYSKQRFCGRQPTRCIRHSNQIEPFHCVRDVAVRGTQLQPTGSGEHLSA
jgi:hypothetical protein